MSTRMGEHQQDWEIQRERLSAYLDDELPAAERARLEAHLAACARCTAELGELRQVVGLLRALPPARAPRSFTLPVGAPAAQSTPAAAPAPAPGAIPAPTEAPVPMGAPRPLHGGPRPRARRAPWTGAAQWRGGVAAAAGLVILLAGAFAGMPHPSGSAGSAAMAPMPSTPGAAFGGSYGGIAGATHAPVRTVTGEARTPSVQAGAGSPDPGTSATTPAGSPGTTAPTEVREAPPPGPALPFWPITGGGLLLGGLVIFVVGRRAAGVH